MADSCCFSLFSLVFVLDSFAFVKSAMIRVIDFLLYSGSSSSASAIAIGTLTFKYALSLIFNFSHNFVDSRCWYFVFLSYLIDGQLTVQVQVVNDSLLFWVSTWLFDSHRYLFSCFYTSIYKNWDRWLMVLVKKVEIIFIRIEDEVGWVITSRTFRSTLWLNFEYVFEYILVKFRVRFELHIKYTFAYVSKGIVQ